MRYYSKFTWCSALILISNENILKSRKSQEIRRNSKKKLACNFTFENLLYRKGTTLSRFGLNICSASTNNYAIGYNVR